MLNFHDSPFKTLIADDHLVVQEGMRAIIRSFLPKATVSLASSVYIEWQDVDFFYYPFVGVNIKIPGFTESNYFSLIVREDKENSPLLIEFIDRLRQETGVILSEQD